MTTKTLTLCNRALPEGCLVLSASAAEGLDLVRERVIRAERVSESERWRTGWGDKPIIFFGAAPPPPGPPSRFSRVIGLQSAVADPAIHGHLDSEGLPAVGARLDAGAVVIGRWRQDSFDPALWVDDCVRLPARVSGVVTAIDADAERLPVGLRSIDTVRIGDVLQIGDEPWLVASVDADLPQGVDAAWAGSEGAQAFTRVDAVADALQFGGWWARKGPDFVPQTLSPPLLRATLAAGAIEVVREWLSIKTQAGDRRDKVHMAHGALNPAVYAPELTPLREVLAACGLNLQIHPSPLTLRLEAAAPGAALDHEAMKAQLMSSTAEMLAEAVAVQARRQVGPQEAMRAQRIISTFEGETFAEAIAAQARRLIAPQVELSGQVRIVPDLTHELSENECRLPRVVARAFCHVEDPDDESLAAAFAEAQVVLTNADDEPPIIAFTTRLWDEYAVAVHPVHFERLRTPDAIVQLHLPLSRIAQQQARDCLSMPSTVLTGTESPATWIERLFAGDDPVAAILEGHAMSEVTPVTDPLLSLVFTPPLPRQSRGLRK